MPPVPLLFLLLVTLGLVASKDAPAATKPKPAPPPPLPPGGAVGNAHFLDKLTPDTVAFVLELARLARLEGITLKLQSGKRSCAQQNALYAQGRTAPGPIITGARGCMSWHVQGRAVDFLPSPNTPQAYARVGALAVQLGGVWGGTFSNLKDLGHVEFHPGKRIEDVCPNPDDCKD